MKSALLRRIAPAILSARIAAAQGEDAVGKAPPVAAEEASLYDLRATLLDQDGRTIPLDHFRGHPVILGMFYTSCAYVCPLLVNKIQAVERDLSNGDRERLRVLLVSFDPERDNPAKLKEKALAQQIDETRWRMARAPEDSIREIAAVLGIRYRRLPDGEFNHSTVLTLVDGRGRVVSRLENLEESHASLAKAAAGAE